MKKLLFAVVALCSTAALADTCTSYMRTRTGGTLDSFTGWGYTRGEACREAQQTCNRELARRRSHGNSFSAFCETDGDYRDPGRGRDPRVERCTYDLKRGNGTLLESFTEEAYSEYSACIDAQSKCESELRYRRSSGRNPRAYCEKRGSYNPYPGPRPDPTVTRSCTVVKVDRWGTRLDRFTSTLEGRQGTGVQERACQEAERECRRNTWGDQRCIRL
ncbi:hypothetical protein M899_1738 [Bacteriovorax sp. BSW11_IV]|uniref:hypothetical protein n=1 Tax=Bacteriovorax sp. BSW11_IV TaxID=1353529 RepID=UPI00038A36C1|nr:hypothetical protein [Bacteriovorax sp. BSW11_IV]EQC49307.1 hypothetical protein M899_1738 [Bacteriovorax sp. BSW11_IV]